MSDIRRDEGMLDPSLIEYGHTDLQGILDAVVRQARTRIPHADEVSVTLSSDGTFYTSPETDNRIKLADSIQFENQEGPCVDTVNTGRPHDVDAMSTETRWPRYVPRARELGIGSSLGIPLQARDRAVAGLNVYSWEENAFDDRDREVANGLAAQAGVFLANAVAFHEKAVLAEQLQQALETRETIGKAIGILMERETITDNDAFKMLRHASQNSNIKLRDIAAEVVERTLRTTRREET